ncbi:MAG: hypothetical protein RI907_289 [Pseudomonadota bacterium]|jgi:hypothetical protein
MNWADTQTWLALAIGALALAHVTRRWWPRRRAPQAHTGTACGTGSSASACGSGCGQCGSAGNAPPKDHRPHGPAGEQVVRVVRPPRG